MLNKMLGVVSFLKNKLKLQNWNGPRQFSEEDVMASSLGILQ